MTNSPDYNRRERFLAQAASTERALWSLANRLNPSLTDKLLAQGATAEQALESIEAVMAHAPTPQPASSPAPQNQTGPSEEIFGRPYSAFGSVFGDLEFDQQYAAGERTARMIMSKVSLTK